MNDKRKTAPAFSLTAPVYDALYGARPIKKNVSSILKCAGKEEKNCLDLRVLDLGCGTGAYALEFLRRGATVTAIDQSWAMIQEARRKVRGKEVKNIAFLQKDITSYQPTKTYDIVVSLFDVLSYLTKNDEVRAFFRLISRALKPGGVSVFDCWYGPGVLLAGPKIMRRSFLINGVRVFRKKTPVISYDTNTVAVHHKLTIHSGAHGSRIVHEAHGMRYFFYPELEEFMEHEGLSVVSRGTLSYPMRTPKKPPWSIAFVVKKH